MTEATKELWEKFLVGEPRETTEYEYHCHADERIFADDFEDMPKNLQAIFAPGGVSLPCDAGGHPGPWCTRCVFGKENETC